LGEHHGLAFVGINDDTDLPSHQEAYVRRRLLVAQNLQTRRELAPGAGLADALDGRLWKLSQDWHALQALGLGQGRLARSCEASRMIPQPRQEWKGCLGADSHPALDLTACHMLSHSCTHSTPMLMGTPDAQGRLNAPRR